MLCNGSRFGAFYSNNQQKQEGGVGGGPVFAVQPVEQCTYFQRLCLISALLHRCRLVFRA